ncbi:EamA family transporter [Xylophilus rhododendri]|uniref:EamA family transporter n=1 Tax=Xylophilus rhododendri TaxID=2697032 RepID=A0A857IZX5_9BURK|nr:DMT family transporter [Xylophilus rhododendri]QHI97164.1 EamA family transporter [Xylophilus rhododendri]
MNDGSRGWLGSFIALAAIWGASFLFMRMGAAEFGPFATAGLRVGLAALVLAPALWLQRPASGMTARRWAWLIATGAFNSGIPFALFSYAVLHQPTGLTSILNATAPLFGALVAWAWLGERPDISRCIGLAVGFGGVALIAQGGGRLDGSIGLLPVLACLGATLCYGIGATMARLHLKGLSPLFSTAGSLAGATLVLALPTVLDWPARPPGTSAWMAVLALALLCSALAYFLYYRLIQRAGAARAMTVTFLIPVFGVSYGAVLLQEPVTATTIVGGLVVLAGTLLASGLVRLPRPHEV